MRDATGAPPRLDPDRLRRARAFRAFSVRTSLTSTVVVIGILVGLHLAGTGIWARDVTKGLSGLAAAYVVVALFGAVGWIVELPFAYAVWRRGRREGLVVQPLAGAFVDQLKSLALALVFVGIPIAVWIVALTLDEWWAITILGALVLSAVVTLLGPAITSLYFRLEAILDDVVAARVRAVAERAGVRVSGVYRLGLGAKTTQANAAVVGIGPTKRIVLGDTLLANFRIDEVEAVVAHEVGHDVSGDPARYLLAFAASASAALMAVRIIVDGITCGLASSGFLVQPACGAGKLTSINGAADIASYPLVAASLVAIAFVGRPVLLAFSRWREAAADVCAARYTSSLAMARALVRLADQNLTDPDPPRWEVLFFHSHPPIAERVRALGHRWEEYATPRASVS